MQELLNAAAALVKQMEAAVSSSADVEERLKILQEQNSVLLGQFVAARERYQDAERQRDEEIRRNQRLEDGYENAMRLMSAAQEGLVSALMLKPQQPMDAIGSQGLQHLEDSLKTKEQSTEQLISEVKDAQARIENGGEPQHPFDGRHTLPNGIFIIGAYIWPPQQGWSLAEYHRFYLLAYGHESKIPEGAIENMRPVKMKDVGHRFRHEYQIKKISKEFTKDTEPHHVGT